MFAAMVLHCNLIWLTCQIFRKEPFFRGHDNNNQLFKIAKTLGTEGLFSYAKKYEVTMDPHLVALLGKFALYCVKFSHNTANSISLGMLI